MIPVYLDYNATAPVHPRVVAALSPFLTLGSAGDPPRGFGNPSSHHLHGREAALGVARAREQVSALLGCAADEIVFTGCGSEADNLALKGVAWAYRDRGRHVVISSVEHPAVAEPAGFLRREGWDVTVVPVRNDGRVDPDAVGAALQDDTVLVSVMHANNETGVLNPIGDISAVAHARGALVHTDAAQSVGKLPTRVQDLGVDLLTVAGHKLYAPKGIGALYVRRGVTLEPLIHGAGHEGGRRAGTENVPWIVALGEACALAKEEGLAASVERILPLRDRLHTLLADALPSLVLNGHPVERLPNTLNVSVPGVPGRAILESCPEVSASTGSACHEGDDSVSGVLGAMGVPYEVALGALRLTLGLFTTEEDVARAAAALTAAARRVAGSG